MRNYDDRDYYSGDICSPRLKCTWLDWASVCAMSLIILYAIFHTWLRWF